MSNVANPYGGNFGTPPQAPQPAKSNTLRIVLIILGIVLFMFLLLCGGLIALLIPAISAAREAAKLTSDSNNMKMVALAVLNYESAYKAIPSSASMNSEKKPVWSWAVAITPYMEEGSIYTTLDFMDMRPWDDPKNKILQGPAPQYLQSKRANLPPGSNESNVFIMSAPKRGQVGPPFSDSEYMRLSEITDGTSNTIMAIQLVKHSKPWASPNPLTVDEAYDLIQQEDKFILVVMFDGSVKQIPTSIDRATFQALATRNGGEVIPIPTYP